MECFVTPKDGADCSGIAPSAHWAIACIKKAVWSVCCVFLHDKKSIMSIETLQPVEANSKSTQEAREPKKEDDKSGDEYERKDPPLEIGEHYLVKRGEDSWRE